MEGISISIGAFVVLYVLHRRRKRRREENEPSEE